MRIKDMGRDIIAIRRERRVIGFKLIDNAG